MKVNIVTLGCSKNTVDSENIAGHLTHAGHTVYFDSPENGCDLVIVNTCGFIGDAKEESVNTLFEQISAKVTFDRRHARDGRRRRLVAVGCLVERYRDELSSSMPEVDAWYGVHQWDELVATESAILNNVCAKARHTTPFVSLRTTSTPSHYAYLKIAEGCDRSCAYCAIPLIRGRHVSRPIDDLVTEAKTLVAQGVKEIILIAQDTTYYGLDLYGRRCLGDLLERLAVESGAEWIRLHYTYPTSFPVDAIDVMRRHDNICKYIDIPLQHINTDILHSMRRGIDREGTLALLRQFRDQLPGVSIRTTLIVGYPGEGDQEFEELKQFVSEAQFDRMGCFAYSQEEGTPAEALGDPVSDEEKQRRVSELMDIQNQISLRKNEEYVGRELRVLVDRREGGYYIARTEYDSPDVDDEVLIPANRRLQVGAFYNVRVTQALEFDLYAEVL